MSLFYLCVDTKCNRKYKTRVKLIDHVLKDHNKIITEADIRDPTEVSKANKSTVNKSKVERITREEALEKAKETERVKAEFARQNSTRILKLEEDRLAAEEEKLKSEEQFLQMTREWINRENKSECSICTDRPADTAVTPCGHARFCMQCILEYKINYGCRGCPYCRGPIQNVVKIFQ